MGLIDDCEQCFATKSLYAVLGLEKDAAATLIKKAYRKASLLLHPDKVPVSGREEATRKFQVLSKVHFILSDNEKKALYDETGMVDDDCAFSSDDSDPELWMNYWRALFPKITKKDIENFFEKYTGSEEELEDLKKAYLECEGDMNKISECFIGYRAEEEDRVCDILNDLIKKKEVPSFPKFTKETAKRKAARQRKFAKEAKEVKEADNMDDLVTAMAKRQQDRESQFNSLISSLESKYGGKESSGKKRRK